MLQNLIVRSSNNHQIMSSSIAAGGPASTAGALEPFFNNPQLVGATWMVSSALFTTYSTTRFLKYQVKPTASPAAAESRTHSLSRLLTTLSRAELLTLCRFGGSLFLGLVVFPDWNMMSRVRDTLSTARHFLLPAVFLYIANFMNSVSLDRIGISLTYTSKCGIPLMTVLLTILTGGVHHLPNALALASLIPIALGIACASWNSPSFEMLGFLAAMTSTLAQSALNVSSKKAIVKTGVRGPEAQRAMVSVGLVLAVVNTVVRNISWSNRQAPASSAMSNESRRTLPPTWLGGSAVLAYHVEYVLSFMFVRLVQPITYGTCDAMRRLAIILTGQAMFGGAPFTHINIFGITLALLGALSYSIASTK